MIIVGASAYPRVIDFARIRAVADGVGAPMMTDMAHIAGLVAAGVHPSPVPHSDFVTTTTHKTLRGPRGGMVLCREQYAKDLDRAVFPGVQGGPLMHVIAAKAVCFKEAARAGVRGLPAADRRQRAARWPRRCSAAGFRLVSGGTDNHLMLVDVFSKGITGKVAEAALGKAGITVNKNAIPFDQNPPMVASGIRIGTPAVTTRGMREPEMDIDRRADRARARRRRTTTRALGDGARRKSKRCAGSSRCTRKRAGAERAPVDAAFARRRRRSRARSPGFEPRAGQRRHGGGRRATSSTTAACCSPKRAPAPARRSPTSCRRSSAASAC